MIRMTETELEMHRQKARGIAQDAILEWGAEQVRLYLDGIVETGSQSRLVMEETIRLKLDKARQDYAQIVFPEYPPEWSDLYAAEFQEAFDAAVKRVEKALGIS